VVTRNYFLALLAIVPVLVGATPLAPKPFDGTQTPVIVLPAESSIPEGSSVQVTVTLNGVTSGNQTVTLGSNSPWVDVDSSVVVPAGQSTATFWAYSNTSNAPALDSGSSMVTITASCNNGSAYGLLSVTH